VYFYSFIFSGIKPIWKFYTNLTCKADGNDIYTDCTFQEGTCNRVTHNYASVQCFKSGTSPGMNYCQYDIIMLLKYERECNFFISWCYLYNASGWLTGILLRANF
jgi:hypothetical protein